MRDLNRDFNIIKTLFGYKNLIGHPIMLNRARKEYDAIKAPNGELEQHYNQLSYKDFLTNDNKSTIRHPYTNAMFVRDYPADFVRGLGDFKEDVDQIDNKPLDDTAGDLINNEYGINLGLRYPEAPKTFIFDNILQYAGLPVPARNNTLYGYIDNLPDTKEDLDKLNKQNESQLFRYLINPIDKYENK
ncbi:hypothetical protein IKP85_06635 [bacterium]|nr:hypothetical protein [bacterium]